MNKALNRAKSRYSVALKSLASDFSIDSKKQKMLDLDKDMIKDFLENPVRYKKQLLDLSLNMYISVPQYQALVKYFYDMPYLTPYVLPVKTGGGNNKIKSDWEKVCYEIEKMNIDIEYRKALSNTVLNGVFYGYEIETEDSYSIKHLDPRYCRVYGSIDGCNAQQNHYRNLYKSCVLPQIAKSPLCGSQEHHQDILYHRPHINKYKCLDIMIRHDCKHHGNYKCIHHVALCRKKQHRIKQRKSDQ